VLVLPSAGAAELFAVEMDQAVWWQLADVARQARRSSAYSMSSHLSPSFSTKSKSRALFSMASRHCRFLTTMALGSFTILRDLPRNCPQSDMQRHPRPVARSVRFILPSPSGIFLSPTHGSRVTPSGTRGNSGTRRRRLPYHPQPRPPPVQDQGDQPGRPAHTSRLAYVPILM
jgi:hypothetical protein